MERGVSAIGVVFIWNTKLTRFQIERTCRLSGIELSDSPNQLDRADLWGGPVGWAMRLKNDRKLTEAEFNAFYDLLEEQAR